MADGPIRFVRKKKITQELGIDDTTLHVGCRGCSRVAA
jgi:hypothetical protein